LKNTLGKPMALLYILLLFCCMLLVYTPASAAPVCSFSYSVKGCSIYLTPSLTDVAYYQWIIAPGDGTTVIGNTGWIPNSPGFTQMFTVDHEGEYRVTLQAKNSAGLTSEYSRLVRTTGSASTASTIQVQPSQVNETFTSRFHSWFNSFPVLGQAALVIIVLFLGAVSFDAVFHVSRGWRKKIFYKTEEMKR